MNKEMKDWAFKVSEAKLPRWEELPDMDLYKDQVVTLVEKYLTPFLGEDEKIITPSMINNYVKWKMIPAPNKKKQYNRVHLAYLIAISILKRVIEIKTVKTGIMVQESFEGAHIAYNTFCEETENAIKDVTSRIDDRITYVPMENAIDDNMILVKMATISFAGKIVAQKRVDIEEKHEETVKKKEGK